ncbi:MAG: hypothetical protein II649_06945 [Kiritimatiellae bacterium]|nr:hypothetical protein [Kiritimatiellia bacterium]
MNYLEELQKRAHEAMREARVAEMLSTMFNLEAQFGERHDDTLRRVRKMFPTLTNAEEEEQDYGRAYKRLHAFCRLHDLY